MLNNKKHGALLFTAFCALLFGLTLSPAAWADAVSEAAARLAASNWLQEKANHMEETLGENIEGVRLYRGGRSGTVGYYLVTFSPNGWMILPADDEYWPIQSFGPGKMTSEQFEKTIWYAVTSFNDTTSLASARGSDEGSGAGTVVRNNKKRWEGLLSDRDSDTPAPRGAQRRPIVGQCGCPGAADAWE